MSPRSIRSAFTAQVGGAALAAALFGSTPALADDAASAAAPPPAAAPQSNDAGGPDIFSKNTFTILLDGRLIVANGAPSFVHGGFGKTRFDGSNDGSFRAQVLPMEADLVWDPRFSNSLSANVSAGWQHDHGDSPDLIEAYLTYLPVRTGNVSVSGRVGLMWPEISEEHSTGGAWSVVNTITPSAINSWVGEETKVIGAEGTLHVSAGEHEFGFTGGVFGWNDTSGTLLSFRGWSLSDEKATAFGHFPLPPRNAFLTLAQQNQTRNTIEIDHQPGWYARADWRPPWPFGVNLYYYDNRGQPEAFTQALQWGWRTRFWNVGLNADLGHQTRLLAQGMIGSTKMGFPVGGDTWVDTDFRSVYVLLTHNFGPFAATGRAEGFATREHGSLMSPDNSEDGWAWTLAARVPVNNYLTVFAEALSVHSWRGSRVSLGGLPSPYEGQSVFQIALRARL
jgi:hypothetical protein